MILGILDFETTGVIPEDCHPLELGYRTYDTTTKKRGSPLSWLFWDEQYRGQISEEITDLTGIDELLCYEEGQSQATVLNAFMNVLGTNVGALCAYNAAFDRTILNRLCRGFGKAIPKQPYLDALTDLPWPARMQRCRKLQHRALDLGLPMDGRESHRALADVNLICDIFDLWDMDEVVEYWKQPWIYIAATIPPPWEDGGKGKDMVKAAGFGWEAAPADDRNFPKRWVKRVKNFDQAEYPFPVGVVK
jgi:DNA polymerase III alpha subunit (gram-positive type)